MKKQTNLQKLLLMSAIAMVGLSSCKKDDDDDNISSDKEPVTLDCSYFNTDRVLTDDPDLDVDYIVNCQANVSGALTIEPGVVIQFGTDAGLKVTSGNIRAEGTSSEPIIFQGATNVAGSWSGIYIGSNNVLNILDYVEVRNAGGSAFNSNDDRGNVIVYAGGRLTLTNSTLTGSETMGLNVNYDDAHLTLTGNAFTDNGDAPIFILANNAHEIVPSNTFSGNTKQYIRVGAIDLDNEVTWQDIGIPYRLEARNFGITYHMNIKANTGLTLEAGVDFEFGSETEIRITDGYLRAEGTPTNKVTFMGFTPVAGAWRGIFLNSGDVRNQLDHVEIAYAGGGEMQGYYGSIVMWADSYLSITNSLVRDGDNSCGINAPLSGETIVTTGTTFSGVANDVCN